MYGANYKPRCVFAVGDFVVHDRADPDDTAESDAGRIIGLGASGAAGKFVRVRSFDGHYRIWSKDRITNIDREG